MVKFINNMDGSKLAIIGSFLLATLAVCFIGWHMIAADGPSVPSEIQYLEGIINAVLATGAGISTVHVVTGAIVNAKQAKNQQQGGPPSA